MREPFFTEDAYPTIPEKPFMPYPASPARMRDGHHSRTAGGGDGCDASVRAVGCATRHYVNHQ